MTSLTIDTTVVRDILESDRPRHADGLRLDAMRKRGEIDFVIAAQGSCFDIPDDPLVSMLRTAVQNGMPLAPQIARLSPRTYPVGNLYPGAYVRGFDEKWAAVVGSWDPSRHGKGPAQHQDRGQVETHLLLERDIPSRTTRPSSGPATGCARSKTCRSSP
jgi:hypothetical protein